MGAAWIIENKHAAIFTPNFNLSSKEFQSGALDPREIGFYINDEERILSFLQLISEDFEISKSHIIISQSVKKFISEINSYKPEIAKPPVISEAIHKPIVKEESKTIAQTVQLQPNQLLKTTSSNPTDLFSKFVNTITSKKLKDDELILLHYIIETGRFKLMTGWQEQNEIDHIKEWEEINEIANKLSRNYSSILKRFELRGFTEVSALTSSNNPKELKIRDEISKHLLDLPDDVLDLITESVKKNHFDYNAKTKIEEPDDLPF
ncbi:TIR_2 superfamily protein [Flavobacterium anhuiense]|uniref:TIR_2 superfamily protein n=2 Tax=Flavobacterium anhuiense TaxID=459526 RepID=A0A444W094_9FLAO|nr:TIR_2 superfamily protein [Flavobacterium anhuiense]